ncbi:MAG: ABC transporter permease [Gemmatimonadales bacterium]
METLISDVRYDLRQLRASPGFTLVAVLTLALGIGANTAVFSVVNGVLLRPLPYEKPDGIVTLWEQTTEQGGSVHVSRPNFRDWQEQARSFEALALHSSPDFGGPTTVLGGRAATRVRVTTVSADFFRIFRVQPALGRVFAVDDFRWGSGVAIVSYGFWRDQLGSNPDLARLTVDVYGRPLRVIGVLPRGFDYPGETAIWGSLPPTDEGRRAHNWQVVGRLREGVTLAMARTEMTRLAARLRDEYGGGTDAAGVRVTALEQQLVGDLRRPVWVLLGAAGFVLLVACTNLASMLLARSAGRQRELTIRQSLGATRGRLVAQLLTESALLASVGLAASLFVSKWLLDAIVAAAPGLPRLEEVRIDIRVLAFTGAIAALATVLFGLLPALRAAGLVRDAALVSAGRGSAPHRSGPWSMLVAGEVSLALVLLIGAGLLVRSLWEVLRQDRGYDVEDVLAVELAPPESKYPDDDGGMARGRYFRRVLDDLTTVPGVVAAGLVNHVPLGGLSWNGGFEIEGRGPSSGATDYRIAGGDFFEALGIRVLRGRGFDERDGASVGDVAVIDEALAAHYWPGDNPVGKRIRNLANDAWIYPDRWLTVIGVVEAIRHEALTAEPVPTVYVHYEQRPARLASATLVLRGAVPPDGLVGPVRDRIRTIDQDVPAEFTTMQRLVQDAVSDRRFAVLVLGGFAALALLLAGVGIYGVVSYAVERRTREVGIRLALGAAPHGVIGMILGDSMRGVAAGAVLGAAGAAALMRVLVGMLYGTRPLDPVVLGTVALLLAAVAGLATYIPARRAARVDPMVALRTE